MADNYCKFEWGVYDATHSSIVKEGRFVFTGSGSGSVATSGPINLLDNSSTNWAYIELYTVNGSHGVCDDANPQPCAGTRQYQYSIYSPGTSFNVTYNSFGGVNPFNCGAQEILTFNGVFTGTGSGQATPDYLAVMKCTSC